MNHTRPGITVLLLPWFAFFVEDAAAAAPRPNLVFILADDK
jgi:hypothetical protein